MADRFGDIVAGFEESLERINAENGRRGISGDPFARHLAQQIVRLKNWGAEREDLISAKDLFPEPDGGGERG